MSTYRKSPESSSCYFALGMSYWFLGNVDSSLAAFTAGREVNPNDTELMAELGFREAELPNLKWEPSRGGDLFPHVHGTIDTALAVAQHPLPLENGVHRFPEGAA